MIPLRDNIPSRTVPVVNYAIIAACALVFVAQLRDQPGEPTLVERYGMIPARVMHPDEPVEIVDAVPVRTPFGIEMREERRLAAPAAVPAWLTLLTCTFLHGGWLHIIGNLWILWIFGDNVEDRLGHVGYVVFYLGCGVAASAAHLLAGPESAVPTIGASGAIAGVMGAYFLLYPKALVMTLIPLFYFVEMVVLPAPVFLGLWFVLQLLQGTMAIGTTEAAGVAWWAHIGGFAAGFLVAMFLRQAHALKPPVTARRPGADHVMMYRMRPRRGW